MVLDKVVGDLQEVRRIKRHYIWEPFMRKYSCETIAELGVCKGENFARMVAHNPKVAVAVDSWIDDGVIARNDGGYSQTVLDQQYWEFVKSMKNKPFVKIYREYSFEAVRHFADNFFDLIYIDADHSYEGCLKDIQDWYPKVKKGKFLLGDDYRVYEGRRAGVNFGVIEAVNEFAKTNNLDFFTLANYGWGIIKT